MSYAAVNTGERIDVRAIPLGLIDNGPAVRRELLDHHHSLALWENIDQLPNIAVRVTGDRYQLIDGRHRLAAHKFAKRDTITAEVYDVDDRQLWIMAVEANTSHGRPLDLAERKAVAAQLLKVAPDLSNRAIAKHCGLNRGTVGKMRPESDDAGVQNGHLPERRTGADGKSYPVPPKPEPVMGEAGTGDGPTASSGGPSPTSDPGEAALGDDAEREPSTVHSSPGSPVSGTATGATVSDSDQAGGSGESVPSAALYEEPPAADHDPTADTVNQLGRFVAILAGMDEPVAQTAYEQGIWEFALGFIADHPDELDLSDVAVAALRTRSIEFPRGMQ